MMPSIHAGHAVVAKVPVRNPALHGSDQVVILEVSPSRTMLVVTSQADLTAGLDSMTSFSWRSKNVTLPYFAAAWDSAAPRIWSGESTNAAPVCAALNVRPTRRKASHVGQSLDTASRSVGRPALANRSVR